ncbi:H-type lectin domain-containing protein [Palleronia abyssalis]|uniref:H-type lectin domain-containing protein n=1 Tax=Palleronia abyssalis TaxID=1501240 RepID=A0A2R8BWD9_9RHOB|nr:H-type lectin domain-containing protein [Palleronia abyssalis]SPJ24472.1 hypothetical protein PAA8504_02303 [Palleronia abyssalis]
MPDILRNPVIQTGTTLVFSHFDTDGPMWTDTGPRVVRRTVRFETPFTSVPSVQVSVSLWDVETSSNLRLEVLAEDVTEEGLVIVAKTWDDSRIARLGASWIAIGEGVDPDAWDLD